MPYFRTKDDCSIYYETQGFKSSRPVVVFLNGTMQATVYWKTSDAALKNRFRVLLYDARAQGQSALGEQELSLEHHAADFAALIKHLGLEKVHLAPCLVISASNDPLVEEEGARELALLCNGRHKHITGVGHSIPAEAPEVFSKTVLEFLCSDARQSGQ